MMHYSREDEEINNGEELGGIKSEREKTIRGWCPEAKWGKGGEKDQLWNVANGSIKKRLQSTT